MGKLSNKRESKKDMWKARILSSLRMKQIFENKKLTLILFGLIELSQEQSQSNNILPMLIPSQLEQDPMQEPYQFNKFPQLTMKLLMPYLIKNRIIS